ncbi:NACHT, LRR and PYD domains-containing protein 6-like [Mobula birostris]|uniref:NACHT, LRR and PYD domains-containing protein 6-like n=1 Tax=Mobula birostris TaxID=1983395 RepID=UPI003B27D249
MERDSEENADEAAPSAPFCWTRDENLANQNPAIEWNSDWARRSSQDGACEQRFPGCRFLRVRLVRRPMTDSLAQAIPQAARSRQDIANSVRTGTPREGFAIAIVMSERPYAGDLLHGKLNRGRTEITTPGKERLWSHFTFLKCPVPLAHEALTPEAMGRNSQPLHTCVRFIHYYTCLFARIKLFLPPPATCSRCRISKQNNRNAGETHQVGAGGCLYLVVGTVSVSTPSLEHRQQVELSCTASKVSTRRIRMAAGEKLNRVPRDLKRYFPDRSSIEDDWDKGNKITKQGQIERNVPMEYGPAAEDGEKSRPRDSGVRDTDPEAGTSTSPVSTISDLRAQRDEYQLYHRTMFYRDKLKQVIEEGIELLSCILRKEGHFSAQEHAEVTELAEKGNRAESSTLFVSLVMGKDSWAQRAMWESFANMQTELPKLDKILKEIQELGPDPHEHIILSRELPTQLKDVQKKHRETLRAQTETLRVNTILMREKVKVFQLVDRYAELTVVSTVRDRRLVENEEWREKHLCGELEKIGTDQLFQSSFSRSEIKSGSSAAVVGGPGIGKTTMVQKIVYDWATGKIYQQFQFAFRFRFRDLNSINCRISLRKLILDQYPYFGNFLRELWKNPEGLLFILDGLDEFKHKIDFADEPKHQCPDPESWCEVSDIMYSLIQHKLLPGCSVLVTTRPTAVELLEKAKISVWAEILGFVGEEQKRYFYRHLEDQKVAAAVFKHVKENEILYTMSHNPSFCCILALALGPFFTQRVRHPQRVPKTVTQLYFYYICNILENHGCEIENTLDVLLRVGQMAFAGVSQRKIVFTDEDLIEYNLQPSQFLSGFLIELLEREDSARGVVYTFLHPTIQDFVAALAQFLTRDPGDILTFLTLAHNTTDGRFEAFLRFVAGLSSPMTTRVLEEFLGPSPHQTPRRVIDWVREEVKRQSGNRWSEAGKNLLNTMYYLFESQDRRLAQAALESVESLSFSGMTLTPVDCAVLSHVIGLCDTIKLLDLSSCHVQGEGFQRLGPCLHKCQDLRLNDVGLTDFVVEDLVSILSTNRSLMDLKENKLGDSGVKLVSAALRNPQCKIQKLELWYVGLTDSGVEDLVSALSTKRSLTVLNLGLNSLTDRSVPALCSLIQSLLRLKQIKLDGNGFSRTRKKELRSLDGPRPGLTVIL